MTTEAVKRVHQVLFAFWAGPGLAISIFLAVYSSVLVVLIWNLALSVYTILIGHFIEWRQEAKSE